MRLLWDAAAAFCLLVEFWITSFNNVFLQSMDTPLVIVYLLWCSTAFFSVDIVLNFNTGYIEKERIISNRYSILKHYMQFWFWVDFIATVPWDILVHNSSGHPLSIVRTVRFARVAKMLKLLRYLRMARTIRMIKTAVKIDRPPAPDAAVSTYVVQSQRVASIFLCSAALAHVHGCIWATLQPEQMVADQVNVALRNYFESFWWAFSAMTVGALGDRSWTDTPGLWTLELIVGFERLIAIIYGAHRLTTYALRFIDEAQWGLIKNDSVRYLSQRKVSLKTKSAVLHSLEETENVRRAQTRFEKMINYLPEELRRSVCEELWVPHLSTLELLAKMGQWNPSFLAELALIVKEEVHASKTVLCRTGDVAIAAYHIAVGRLGVELSHTHTAIGDFTMGMWLGEKALVNVGLLRSATVKVLETATLMTVPAQAFQELISALGLTERFQVFCTGQLMVEGMCGRCGKLGHRFTDTCPGRHRSTFGNAGSLASSFQSTTFRWLCGVPILGIKQRSEPQMRLGSDLKAFLKRHGMMEIGRTLQQLEIEDLDALEEMSLFNLKSALPSNRTLSPNEELVLEAEYIRLYKNRWNRNAHEAIYGKTNRLHHLVFLCHYKLEAGTEAALMREGLVQLAGEDKRGLATRFDVPFFLDVDDLGNLKELQDHVQKCHNLVILLTKGILTRPWCLVEIVTAVREGLAMLPVQISKELHEFDFPDDAWYRRFINGEILAPSDAEVLHDCGIALCDVEHALREVFKTIATRYSPHRPANVRHSELDGLLRRCSLKQEGIADPVRHNRTRSESSLRVRTAQLGI